MNLFFSENKLNLDRLFKLEHKSNEYFIGPIYSKENSDLFFKTIKQYQDQNNDDKQLYWLAPSDEFLGVSQIDLVILLIVYRQPQLPKTLNASYQWHTEMINNQSQVIKN